MAQFCWVFGFSRGQKFPPEGKLRINSFPGEKTPEGGAGGRKNQMLRQSTLSNTHFVWRWNYSGQCPQYDGRGAGVIDDGTYDMDIDVGPVRTHLS